jgi:DNA-binding MarR family transcriptional regulator
LSEVESSIPNCYVPDILSDDPSYPLFFASHAYDSAVNQALQNGAGLSHLEFGMLSNLLFFPGSSCAEIARRDLLAPQTVNATLLRLESRGMIERNPHAIHGRILEGTLTTAGLSVLERGCQIVAEVRERMLSDLSAEERSQFYALLMRCWEGLTPKKSRRRSRASQTEAK